MLRPPGCDAVVQRELDVDSVGVGVGVDERVAALVLLVAVGEPHPDPHRRVQRPIGEHAARVEAQPQVVRTELAVSSHCQLVVAGAKQLEYRAAEPTRRPVFRHLPALRTVT
jgi:hypothetical protein